MNVTSKCLGRTLLFALTLAACNNAPKENSDADEAMIGTEESGASIETEVVENDEQGTVFRIESVPVSTADLGSFPFFKLPDGYVYTAPRKNNSGEGITMDFDREYFLIDGRYHQVDGKSFKAQINVERGNTAKQFSDLELSKSFEELIKSLGGVKVNDGKRPEKGETDRIEANAYSKGYLHSSNNFYPETYVIRTADAEVWVQFYLSPRNKSGSIAILQKGELDNTMRIIRSDDIRKELDETGKAVLYINFDVDKATLKPEGQEAVAEISKALQADTELRLSIEGHTDNTGNAAHNKSLSLQRAEAVVAALVASGITKERLKAEGFGAERPLVANDSEANKAKNRRVELVKY